MAKSYSPGSGSTTMSKGAGKSAMGKHGISTGAGHVPAAKAFRGKQPGAPKQPGKGSGAAWSPTVKTHF